MTDEDAWVDAVARTLERFGSMDVLVNNAGIANAAPIEHFSLEKWNAVIAVNLTGVFLGCRAVVPAMKAQGAGSIINISSVEGMRGSAGLHGYTASKFGVRGLTQGLAVELGPSGIRVNSVHPGLILTEMTTRIDPARLDIPLGRPGLPADVAGTVVFLASDASAFTTRRGVRGRRRDDHRYPAPLSGLVAARGRRPSSARSDAARTSENVTILRSMSPDSPK